MSTNAPNLSVEDALLAAKAAVRDQELTAAAYGNLETWLTEKRYQDYRNAILEHIENAKWQKLDDVFWTVIPFGTGGRRGRMYPFGSNAINERTIGESAQGLASYVQQNAASGESLSLRHRLRHSAPLTRIRRAMCGHHGS